MVCLGYPHRICIIDYILFDATMVEKLTGNHISRIADHLGHCFIAGGVDTG